MPKYQPYTVQDVKDSSARELFTVVSTFAGGGGSSTGYRLAGGKVIAINEFVEEAIKTYSMNFPDTKIVPGDIKGITGADLLAAAGLKPGELDILDGSPPCSAFSVAGKREKGWNKEKTYSDGKKVENIEDLFLEFIRIAGQIQPKVIVAENVKGITMGEAVGKLNEFRNAFEQISPGYFVTYQVLSAADFGTPQSRERTFFVCIRHDVADKVGIHMFNAHDTVFPKVNKQRPEHISISEAFENLVNDPEQEKMLEDYVQNCWQKKWVEMLPLNPHKHTKPSMPEFRDVNPKASLFNMIRPAPHLPSPTVTQAGQKRGVSGVLHFERNRKLTVPELKRVMGLPDDYKLSGTFDQQAERIGRMVAPKMMAALATNIYQNVLVPYKKEITS
jgi:DNA (cytosine-5)-methyltransferase 1